jgi:hypothetical protein
MFKTTKALAALLLLTLVTGCTSVSAKEAASPSAASTENPYGGFAVDNPADNEVILTITGPTGTQNFSISQLRTLEAKEFSIMEPFAKSKQSFKGVQLSTLFALVGIEGSSKVSTMALNDYKFDDLAENFTGSNGILAYERDGAVIPMDQGGPIRIVFPTGSKYFTYLDSWNWSLRSISVVE